MTATVTAETPIAPPPTRRGGRSLEPMLFAIAIAVIGVHVLDDSLVQPPSGVSAGDQLVSAMVPLGILALAAWARPRLPGAGRGTLALVLGVLGIATGLEAVYYTSEVGPSGDDFSGLLALPAGVMLLALGAATLWRTRRMEGHRAWRYARRVLLFGAAYVAAAVAVLPVGFAYVTTHTARAVVPPDHLGVAHEDVSFTTSDGLKLEGWYIPSRNRAAVISFPGRSGTQRQARMLARHGYGVLLFDRRGEGRSQGAPNAFGWGGDRDIKAAIGFLRRRVDVDAGRIGGIGLSVGGELMLETAAETTALKAVVSEGAGARSYAEEIHQRWRGIDRVLSFPMSALKTASLAVFSNQSPPPDLKHLAAKIAPRPLLLIAAPNSHHGEELNRRYLQAAGKTAALWEIPESTHVGGLRARPAEYEQRVLGFFDHALLQGARP